MQELIKKRTKQVGLDVIVIADQLPNKPAAWVLGKQVIRSATSVGANYRAACRAKSGPDFIHKLKIVEEEADESIFWLELLEEGGLIEAGSSVDLRKELDELLAIVVASIKTARKRGGK